MFGFNINTIKILLYLLIIIMPYHSLQDTELNLMFKYVILGLLDSSLFDRNLKSKAMITFDLLVQGWSIPPN